ncbi:MAG: tetratricopeptide repeat protein [Pseudomonadota bacterium]
MMTLRSIRRRPGRFAAAVLACCIASGLADAQQPASKPQILVAFEKLSAGDFDEARRIAEPLAAAGDVNAMHMVGFLDERGLGGEKNMKRAIEYYFKAANGGSADAQFALGELAYLGEGVSQDYARAVSWFEIAAGNGHVQAMVRLGMLYAEGLGAKADQKKAVNYFRKAGELGDAGAQHNMGVAYLLGRGLPKNYDKARDWFEKAAEQDHADAQYNLALIYDADYLGAPDPQATVKWMAAAAKNGLPAAYVAMGLLTHEGRVTPEGGAEVAASAADWFEKAAQAGDPQGQFLFAAALAKGDGRPANRGEALAWLERALTQENRLAPQTRENAKKLRSELM